MASTTSFLRSSYHYWPHYVQQTIDARNEIAKEGNFPGYLVHPPPMPTLTNTRALRARLFAKTDIMTTDNFKIESVELNTDLQNGEILLRNLYLAIDPMLFEEDNPMAGAVAETVTGFGIAEVVDSKNAAYPVSTIVLGLALPWEQYTRLTPNPHILLVILDPHNPKVPLTEYTNLLGVNGFTAYGVSQTSVELKKG
ncbi:hypothetical protein EDD21DRAFT_355518 [Dissophora ornata]|nr:hypothetical protein EDD21DRAFT_355518 [Dissophora ornata]